MNPNAELRTSAAIAEGLGQVCRVGGIWRASESELEATIDFLKFANEPSADPLGRARDLMIAFVRRGCDRRRSQRRHDLTAQAAAASLQQLPLTARRQRNGS
jgi:hypothetical protein